MIFFSSSPGYEQERREVATPHKAKSFSFPYEVPSSDEVSCVAEVIMD